MADLPVQKDSTMNGIERLLRVMKTLRDPEKGCPWDKDQTFATIAPYTLEEAYEVADAIAREDWHDLQGELGDLLFQVVFYAQMAQENQWYTFDDIAHAMCDKLERRHPHVFAEGRYHSHQQLHQQWEERKVQEREQRAKHRENNQAVSLMDDIPLALPELMRAQKIQKRAASVGFDWPEVNGVLDKLQEEIAELKEAIAAGEHTQVHDEMGDVLFTAVNLSRHLQVKAEEALRQANQKFVARFKTMEQQAENEQKPLNARQIAELELLWQQAKQK